MLTLLLMKLAPVGLLIIRARVEKGSSRPLRADVRLTADTTRGFERELRFSEAAAVAEVVRSWLAEISGDDEPQEAPQAVTPPSRRPQKLTGHSAESGRMRQQGEARERAQEGPQC